MSEIDRAPSVPGWVDSHCHLGSLGAGDRAGDRAGDTAEDPTEDAIVQARESGVIAMVCVGTDLDSSRVAVELASLHDDVCATVGLHPHDASHLASQWEALADLARDERVVAIGEAGFDHYYSHSAPPEQEAAFRAQIRLAHELERALVVHSRDAWDDTFRVLAEEGMPAKTVLHCFTGGPVEARRALETGAYLSFSGIISFKNAAEVREAARLVPLDRLLVETDAPYLAPVPHRGRENRPAWVVEVGNALAATTGRDRAEIAAATRANAATVFGHPF